MKLLDSLEKTFRLQDSQKKALKKIGLETVEDLLWHFPIRYGDTAEIKNIDGLIAGQTAVVFGRISNLKTSKAWVNKTPMAEGLVDDDTGKIKIIWFHQPYIAKMIHNDAFVRVEGKISDRNKVLSFINPKVEVVTKLPIGVGDSLFGTDGEAHSLYPIYPESRGITSNWFYHAISKILLTENIPELIDPIPKYILKTYNLPSLATALIWIHLPQKKEHALSARKRFAFEEVFLIQLQKKRNRLAWQKEPSFVINKTPEEINQFIKRFPFTTTNAQNTAIKAIMSDFKKGHAMSRLLEGDVGSGKTAVAAATAFAVITTKPLTSTNKNEPVRQSFGNLQTAYMAPTEILAKQHFENFIKYFTYLGINIGLITGQECRKFPSKTKPTDWTNISRAQLLKWVENGEIPILIGTHALIQKSVKFKHLAYVIIDEQHRFGTSQRKKLLQKDGLNPHLLSMTATPIPRTLALTIYGDLDLTLLDQMPAGRKPIITEVVLPGERENTYTKIKQELATGRQVYVICPRIDLPDSTKEQAVLTKSVIEEAGRLEREVFPNYEIGILHSKMLPADKEYVMEQFKAGKINILVATSVVEVGVNVPNATVIIIEGAERFGLAQLHQLRGRVIRSNHQAYCYVFADSKTQKTVTRLKAFKNSLNGFELAEYDLQLRGPGELAGNKQWGITDIGMEALRNLKMVEAARTEAEYLLDQDETLSSFPLLNEKLAHRKTEGEEIHFE